MALTDEARRPTEPNSHFPLGKCRLCGGYCEPKKRWHPGCFEQWREATKNGVTRDQVFERDGWSCRLCGFHSLIPSELRDDHIEPIASTGLSAWNDLSNRQTLCVDCHRDKTDGENVARNAGTSQVKKPSAGRGAEPSRPTVPKPTGEPAPEPDRGDALKRAAGWLTLGGVPALMLNYYDLPGGVIPGAAGGVAAALVAGSYGARLEQSMRQQADASLYAALATVTQDPVQLDSWRRYLRVRWRVGLRRTPSSITLTYGRFFKAGDPSAVRALVQRFAEQTLVPVDEVGVKHLRSGKIRLWHQRHRQSPLAALLEWLQRVPPLPDTDLPDEPETVHATDQARAREAARVRLEQGLSAIVEDARVAVDRWDGSHPLKWRLIYPTRASITMQSAEIREQIPNAANAVLAARGKWVARRDKNSDWFNIVDEPRTDEDKPTLPVAAFPNGVPATQGTPAPAPVAAASASVPAVTPGLPWAEPLSGSDEEDDEVAKAAAQVASRRDDIRARLEAGLRGAANDKSKRVHVEIDGWHGEDGLSPRDVVLKYHPGMTVDIGDKLHDMRRVLTGMVKPQEDEWGVAWEPEKDRVLITDKPDPLIKSVPLPPQERHPDLFRGVIIGVQEDGQPLYLPLAGGVQWLFAGASGAGKGGLLWSVLYALEHMIAEGLVRVWIIDPKNGAEFSTARPITAKFRTTHRDGSRGPARQAYARTSRDGIPVLIGAHEAMEEKARWLGDNDDAQAIEEPTLEHPMDLIIVDELAAMSELADKDTQEAYVRYSSLIMSQGRAPLATLIGAVQDPRKATIPNRGLHTSGVALRLVSATETNMVLGQGARNQGALADLIPKGKKYAGILYMQVDGAPDPVRGRCAYLAPEDKKALVQRILARWDERDDTAAPEHGAPVPVGEQQLPENPPLQEDADAVRRAIDAWEALEAVIPPGKRDAVVAAIDALQTQFAEPEAVLAGDALPPEALKVGQRYTIIGDPPGDVLTVRRAREVADEEDGSRIVMEVAYTYQGERKWRVGHFDREVAAFRPAT